MIVGPTLNDFANWPVYRLTALPRAISHKHLGTLLDEDLCFEPHLSQAIARWQTAFKSHMGAGHSKNLPVVILASTVPPYVISVALHGIAFCIKVPNVEDRLNRIQAFWARNLLGARHVRGGKWAALINEVGWCRRLGSMVLCEALMLEARAALLPPTVPTVKLLLLARGSTLTSWASRLIALRGRLGNLPSIETWLCEADIASARDSSTHRKACLDAFRKYIVLPALDVYDDQAFVSSLETAPWDYLWLQECSCRFPFEMLHFPWTPNLDKHLKIWSLTRATGRLPLPIWGIDAFPKSLEFCPLCCACDADIAHVILRCPELSAIRREFNFPALPWKEFVKYLFAGPVELHMDGTMDVRMEFLSRVMEKFVVGYLVQRSQE